LGREEERGVIVMKFGGSSVADAERILGVARIVRRHLERRPVVVVSALGGVTDLLDRAFDRARQGDLEGLEPVVAEIVRRHRWALAGCVNDGSRRHRLDLEIDRLFEGLQGRLRSVRILGEGTDRARDAVLAHGEWLAARIVTAALRETELPARRVDPGRLIVTDERFGAAKPRPEAVRTRVASELLPLLEAGEVPVVGGFVGSSEAGETTTLGRGGSDTTAATLGLALEAEEIQIWTDVEGLMSADPRIVPGARTLARVSFAEAAELALYGARVLHPDSISPAVRRRIPVRVSSSLRPEGASTLVLGERPEGGAGGPLAVASKDAVVFARVTSRRMPMDPTLATRALQVCADAGLAPELMLSSATTLSMVSTLGDRLDGLSCLQDEAEIELSTEHAIACVVGCAVVEEEAVREQVMAELARWKPELVALGALRASVVAVVRRDRLADCVRRLHDRFSEVGGVR
jgi:aspartate kinase